MSQPIDKPRHHLWRGLRILLVLALFMLARQGIADDVTVKGTVLQGTITSLSASKVEFKTVYGKGTLDIPFADIQNLTTDASCVVYYGEDAKATGRISALSRASCWSVAHAPRPHRSRYPASFSCAAPRVWATCAASGATGTAAPTLG